MGVEIHLIKVLLMYNAKVCKLQKLKSICLQLANGNVCNTRHKQHTSLQA